MKCGRCSVASGPSDDSASRYQTQVEYRALASQIRALEGEGARASEDNFKQEGGKGQPEWEDEAALLASGLASDYDDIDQGGNVDVDGGWRGRRQDEANWGHRDINKAGATGLESGPGVGGLVRLAVHRAGGEVAQREVVVGYDAGECGRGSGGTGSI